MMGNLASSASRGSIAEPSLSLPRLASSWRSLNHDQEGGTDAGEHGDVSSTNGLFETKRGDKTVVVPEEVMEILLSYVDLKDILSITQVCRLWKDITTSLSFWKAVCSKHGLKWTDIPVHVRNKPSSWIALYSICRDKLLRRNLVLNHSGILESRNPLIGWTVHQNGGDRLRMEAIPRGIDPLPPDPFFNNSNNCIVTSYGFGELSYNINLWNIGLNPSVMKLLLPFKLEFSQMVGARFDCGGFGSMTISTWTSKGEKVFTHSNDFRLVEGSNWTLLKTSVVFPEQTEEALLENTVNLKITLMAKDSKFWAGHYGPKFARTSATLCLIHNLEQVIPGEVADTIFYVQNATGLNELRADDYNYEDFAMNFDDAGGEEEDDDSNASDIE